MKGKLFRIFCSVYFTSLVYSEKPVSNIPTNPMTVGPEVEIKLREFETQSNKIRSDYLTQSTNSTSVTDDLVKEGGKLIEDVCKYVEKNSKEKNKPEIRVLKKWKGKLESSLSVLGQYREHMKKVSERITKEKTEIVTSWKDIKKVIDASSGWFSGSVFSQKHNEENKQASETYLNFTKSISKLLSSNSTKGSSNLAIFIDKITKFVLDSTEKDEEKKKKIEGLIVSVFLREYLKSIRRIIDPNELAKLEGDVMKINMEFIIQAFVRMGVDIDNKKLLKNEKTKGLAVSHKAVFDRVPVDDLKMIVQVSSEMKIEKIEEAVELRYRNLINIIQKQEREGKIDGTKVDKKWVENILKIKKAHISLIKLAVDVIGTETITEVYINKIDGEKIAAEKEEIDITNSVLTADSIRKILGVKAEENGILYGMIIGIRNATGAIISAPITLATSAVSLLYTDEWNNVLKSNIKKDDEAIRVSSISKIGKGIGNIELLLNSIPSLFLKEGKVEELEKEIVLLGSTIRGMIYSVKYSADKKKTGENVELYLKPIVECIVGLDNLKEYNTIKSTHKKGIENISPIKFITDKEKSDKVLKYMKDLAEDYYKATKLTYFLHGKEKEADHTKAIEEIRKVEVEKLEPSKSIELTKVLYTNLQNKINILVESIEKRGEIKNRVDFYGLWKEMVHFNKKLELLSKYTAPDATKIHDEMKKYLEGDVYKSVNELVKEEKESKGVRIEALKVESILLSLGHRIPDAIRACFGGFHIESHPRMKVQANDSESVGEASSTIDQNKINYLNWAIGIVVVLAVVGVMGFFLSKKKQQNSVL